MPTEVRVTVVLPHRDPFSAYFKLHDDTLSLHDIMEERVVREAEFAFLAACHAATGDRQKQDEAFSLATTAEVCTFRRVVGATWAMHGNDDPSFAEGFYRHVMSEGMDNAAVALDALRCA